MGAYIKSLNMVKAKNGLLTANVVTQSGLQFHLHSIYNPEKEAKDWLKQFAIQANTIYVVLGFGLGYHVKALLDRLDDKSHVFVVEHSAEENMLGVSRQIFPKATWMFQNNFDCLISEDIRDMAAVINKMMQRKNIKRVVMCPFFPMMQIYPDFYRKVESELVAKTQELFGIDYDYRISASTVVARNAWLNLPYICDSAGIAQFKDAFCDIPVIMVAGGPSLNKNIHLLREYQNKAVIICAGSTIGALHHHGVKPHFLVAVDPFIGTENEIIGCVDADTALLAPYIVPYELVKAYPGNKFFFTLAENSPNINAISGLKELLPATEELYANISVAISAVSFALYGGAKTVIIMGQDLAFGEDLRSHASGSRALTLVPEGHTYEDLVSVSGYYGGEVKTIPIFKEAIDYYGSLFAFRKDVTFINATEGGAYLNGAEHMPFQNVVTSHLSHPQDSKTFFEMIRASQTDFNYEPMIERVKYDCQQLQVLHDRGELLLQESEKCPQYIQANDSERAIADMEKFEMFFREVRQSLAYVHLIPYIHALFELYDYKKQDGYDDLEERFLNQTMMFVYIRSALQDLLANMNTALSACEVNLAKR